LEKLFGPFLLLRAAQRILRSFMLLFHSTNLH
jgi:hypothetical protein